MVENVLQYHVPVRYIKNYYEQLARSLNIDGG